jgi:cytidylate kinase
METESGTMDSGSQHTALLVTIDGPAGAGKTTVSRRLAKRLGYTYVDTGALYRAVAVAAKAAGITADDVRGLDRLCRAMTIEYTPHRLLVDGGDVTDLLRRPDITMLASAISAQPVVRRHLLAVQRALGRRRAAVFEGRDMGTVVFPDADVKFYLDASLDIRALRRHREFNAAGAQTIQEVTRQMRRRDRNDTERAVSPLQPAPDAIRIDSTALSVDAVVDRMMAVIAERQK